MSTLTMQTLQGIAVSPSIAMGEASVIDHGGFCVPRRILYRIAVADDFARLRPATEEVAVEINRHRGEVSLLLDKRDGAIFEAHPPNRHGQRLRGYRSSPRNLKLLSIRQRSELKNRSQSGSSLSRRAIFVRRK